MAILIMPNGKFAETNKGALVRAANDHGDKIAFTKRPHFEDVLLNSNPVGKLFESHEQAIAFLAQRLRATGKPGKKVKSPGVFARKNPAQKKSEDVIVEITPEVFERHIRGMVVPQYREFGAYKKAFPNYKAVFSNGRIWRVTKDTANGVEFDNGQGRRIGMVKPDGKAFRWEIRDPAGKLIFDSERNNPSAAGLFYTAGSALRSLKSAADTFGS